MTTYDTGGKWYHGSPLRLGVLLAGSTISQKRDLARIFSHKPSIVLIDDNAHIAHNGTAPGYLYEIAEPVMPEDVKPHPRTTMPPGDEWIISRPLMVVLLSETTPDPAEALTPEEQKRLRALKIT
ncbi:MAG: hypothetical protein E4H27_03330 [Anaerolineales bacterium]|nr:MAG: hypothetical protein E4H27_03330 [Anaerolineales bacterium]